MNEKIYILLPVHNRKKVTVDFIKSLQKQNYKNYELLLIDDGSTDGTAEYVKQRINNLSVITGNGNLWWAGCLNKGIDWLADNNIDDNSIILIINDDVLFDSDFIQTGIDILSQSKKHYYWHNFA